MRKQSKILYLLFFTFLIIFSFCGCKKNSPAPENTAESQEAKELKAYSKYISYTDKDLVAGKGVGTESKIDINGSPLIIARTYSEKLFGFDSKAVFSLGDGKAVNEIIFNFDGVRESELSKLMVHAFGGPFKVTDESDKTNLQEQWISNGYLYSLLDDKKSVTLSILKNG